MAHYKRGFDVQTCSVNICHVVIKCVQYVLRFRFLQLILQNVMVGHGPVDSTSPHI